METWVYWVMVTVGNMAPVTQLHIRYSARLPCLAIAIGGQGLRAGWAYDLGWEIS